MIHALALFVAIYLLNLIPAFAPPTWMALSWIGFSNPTVNSGLLALIAAAAATLGRLTLARLSRGIVRQHWLGDSSRRNIDAIRQEIERRPLLTVGAFVFYAFSPLPSSYLFVAYGLTTLKLRLIAIPFFIGRFVSYNVWASSSALAARHLVLEAPEAEPWLGLYFVLTQCLFLALVYAFTRVDWRLLLQEGHFRWRKANGD